MWRRFQWQVPRFFTGDGSPISTPTPLPTPSVTPFGPVGCYNRILDVDHRIGRLVVDALNQDGQLRPWINLNVGHRRYGWDPIQRRWAYNRMPQPEVLELLRTWGITCFEG